MLRRYYVRLCRRTASGGSNPWRALRHYTRCRHLFAAGRGCPTGWDDVGRCGWTWHTGSAGRLYRSGLEWIFGFRVRGTTLSIDSCIARTRPGYSISFRYHSATYKIRVENPLGVSRRVAHVELEGKPLQGSASFPPTDDGIDHVLVVLGGAWLATRFRDCAARSVSANPVTECCRVGTS